MTFAARNRVAIVGYGQSPIVRHADRPLGAVALDVARAAIADAGLEPADVDGFVTSTLFPTAGDHAVVDGVSTVSANWLAQHLGVEPRYAAGFQGFGQLPGVMALGVNAVASGAADHVLVHRALHNPQGRYHDTARTDARGPAQWVMPQGFFGPVTSIGMTATEYLQRYGATREDLGRVVVEARKHGARLPWSYWHGQPLTLDEYLDAPLLADPICRFDCDIPVDGVAAFVLTTAERARDLPHRPVHVAGYANGQPNRHRLPLHWPVDDLHEVGARTAALLWERSGFGPDAVDLPQLYDGFSPFIWFWLEVLGFCPVGEAARFVADGGIDADRPGALPALTSGGALGNGRMHGVPQLLECYLQLSDRAGDRQREATVGLACHASPHYGGVVALTNTPA